MRFVSTDLICKDMLLSKDLYDANGNLLVKGGNLLNDTNIAKIKALGYNGLYINDELSMDILIDEVVNNGTKQKTVMMVKNFFQRINRRERNNSLDELKVSIESIIDELLRNKTSMINIVDIKSSQDYLYYHSFNVAILSLVMGIELGLGKKELYELGLAALLHDVGKMFVANETVEKTAALTAEETAELRTHCIKGYRYLKEHCMVPLKTYMGVLEHHEKFNGSGYPNKKTGEKIIACARIISIANVYDALTSNRSHQKGLLPSEAMEYIMGSSGVIFDPQMVTIFTRIVAPYPVGTFVELSSGEAGIVVANYQDCCLRPKVKVIRRGSESVQPYFVDLKNDYNNIDKTVKGIAV